MRTLPFEGHMACDNKAVVHQVHTFLPTTNTSTTPARVNPAEVYIHPLSAEWDVLIEIYHTVRLTWSATTKAIKTKTNRLANFHYWHS